MASLDEVLETRRTARKVCRDRHLICSNAVDEFLSIYLHPNLNCSEHKCYMYGNGDEQDMFLFGKVFHICHDPKLTMDENPWYIRFDDKIYIKIENQNWTFELNQAKQAAHTFLEHSSE